jgi:type II secretory pathway pseudopilin PulG
MKMNMKMSAAFSLIEMMVAMAILMMVLIGTMSGWLFVVYGERQNSIQNKLDLDVRIALENVRRDLRLSSMSKMFYYPSGAGPYDAISFPMAVDNDGDGLIELNASSNIIWDITKVYHRFTNLYPFAFFVTTITNRDNTLTDAQRQAQVDSIATTGDASSTYEAANASRRTLFKNLFTWAVTPDGAVFDGYATEVQRVDSVTLGSVLMASGSHTFKFQLIGKNPSASSYRIGLDTMAVSPSGGQREMERQTVSAQVGATAVREYHATGSWSENYDLAFPASATSHYVTLSMENDRWEDSVFGGTGADNSRAVLEFDTTLSPMDNVVRLEGMGWTWFPDSWNIYNYSSVWDNTDRLYGDAVRVRLRGGGMTNGAWLGLDGRINYFYIDSGSAGTLHVQELRIAEAADHINNGPNAASAGMQLLLSGNSSRDIPAWSFATITTPSSTPFYIEKEKSYIISMFISNAVGTGNARLYHEKVSADITSFIVDRTNGATQAMLSQPSWGGYTVDQDTNLYGVAYGMNLLYAPTGTYQSAVYDTHQTTPAYQDVAWSVDLGFYATMKMKVRSADNEDMSDASAWTNLSWMSSAGAINPGAKRYVQYLAQLISSSSGWETPRLKDVTVRFTGEQKIVDVGGALTRGPNYGIFEMLVDNVKLQRGVTVAMEVYEDMPTSGGSTKRLTSKSTVEVEPRNTGK